MNSINQPSLTFFPALEASALPLSAKDSAPLDSRKSTPTPAWSSKSIGRMSPITETCDQSPESRLMSLQEDFRVSLLDYPDSAAERPMSGSYGLNALESCAKYDRHSHSLRTYQASLQLGGVSPSTECLVTFARSGMICSGIVYQLAPLARLSSEIESGFLPAPTKSMGKRGWGISNIKPRYSPGLERRARMFGYKPHARLLEWGMGYPKDFTMVEFQQSATPSSRKSRKSSPAQSTSNSNQPVK